LGILFIYILINRKRKDTFGMTFIFLFGLASVCLYYFGGFITNSLVILSRARELYSLAVPVTLGACFYCLINVLAPKKETGFFVAFVTVLFITCISIILLPPVIIPYKMESNASVEQYIKISKNYRATEWLIVSQEEGYALSLGKGWHLMTGDFLKEYDPLEDDLIGNGETVPKLNVPHIFIYIESRPYETYTIMPELKDAYDRRVKEAVLLEKWITDYTSVNGSPQVFYKDEQLTVYYIYQPYAQTELSERVLGPKIK